MNSAPVIRIQDLAFAWRPGLPTVLHIPQLEMQAGERLLVKGPSGSGKSTLLGLLGGVNLPSSGSVTILGQDLAALRHHARDRFRADHVGFVFQLFNLLPYLSVLDNVLLPCRFSRQRRARVEQRGGLEQEATRLLQHLDLEPALRHRQARELSVGQQQRVAAARALIGSPELVIADEPTSALDADRRESFVELLKHECDQAGSSLVFVSHDTAMESHFERFLELAAVGAS